MSADELASQLLCGLDAFSTKAQKQAAYATIHEELGNIQRSIQALEERAVTWKSYHNSLSDCYRLPDDILIDIWKYLAHDASNLTTQWLSITHVSSRWRHLALNSPVLWTWPCVWRSSVAEEMLLRAKHLKLTLLLDRRSSMQHQNDVLKARAAGRIQPIAISQLAHRIAQQAEAIILKFPDSQLASAGLWNRIIFHGRSELESRTNLEYLEIFYPENTPSQAAKSLDQTLLCCIKHSPRLKTLLLNGHTPFYPQADSSVRCAPASLTHLKVSFKNESHAQLSSIISTIESLMHLTALKSLTLENVFKPLEWEEVSWCKNVSHPLVFDDLVELQLEASAAISNIFLGLIKYHPTASIQLRGLWEEPIISSSHVDALTSILRTSTQRITPSISHLILNELPLCSQWSITFKYVGDSIQRAALVSLAMPQLPGIIERLTSICPLNKLQELMYGLSSSNEDIWQSFGSLEELRFVSLDSFMHPSFARVLQSLHHPSSTVFDLVTTPTQTNYRPSLYFPSLQRVVETALVDEASESFHQRMEFLSNINSARNDWLATNASAASKV